MNRVIEQIEAEQMRQDLPEIEIGDTVRVHLRITEGEGKDRRTRIQVFEGVVIGRHGRGLNDMLTVRRVTYGIGVERIFPVHGPNLEKIEVTRKGDVRRAKLHYLRGRVGKAAKVRERSRWATPRGQKTAAAAPVEEPAELEAQKPASDEKIAVPLPAPAPEEPPAEAAPETEPVVEQETVEETAPAAEPAAVAEIEAPAAVTELEAEAEAEGEEEKTEIVETAPAQSGEESEESGK